MRNFQGLPRWRGRCNISTANLRFRANDIDPNRNALLQFNLANSDRTICTVEYTLHEASLRVTRPISKLWHRSWTLVRNSKFVIPNSPARFFSNLLFHSFPPLRCHRGTPLLVYNDRGLLIPMLWWFVPWHTTYCEI